MTPYGMGPSIPGAQPKAAIFQIENGWLVSHPPKPVHEPPLPDAPKTVTARKKALREAEREAKKQELKMIVEASALSLKVAQGEEWDPPDIDKELSRIVPPSIASSQYMGIADYADYAPVARAFPTLKDALDYLATVLE